MTFYDDIRLAKGITQKTAERLEGAVVVNTTNVAKYIFEDNEQEEWDLLVDFPNVAPPFHKVFYETRAPKFTRSGPTVMPWDKDRPSRWGHLVEALPVDDQTLSVVSRGFGDNKDAVMRDLIIQDPKWMLKTTLFTENGLSGAPSCRPWFMWNHLVSKMGKFITTQTNYHPNMLIQRDLGLIKEDRCCIIMSGPHNEAPPQLIKMCQDNGDRIIDWSKSYAFVGFVTFMAMSFMHCKNIVVKKNETDQKLRKAQIRRHGSPSTAYHTIEIDPMRKVLRSEGGSDKAGLRKALHICRGHFKNFDEHPLFGKYKGTYWWDQQARGREEHGKVISDYKVVK